MHLLHQQEQNQLYCLFFILITQTISIPIKETVQSIRCNILHQNCTFIQGDFSTDSFWSSVYFHGLKSSAKLRATRQNTTSWSTLSTSDQRFTTQTSTLTDFDAFSDNLKRAALILAGVALGLGILRICLMLCKSRSSNNSFSNRHSSTVRPQIATIDNHHFKPDLPPAYAEAITYIENDGGKLPSYEELPNEQRQEQHVHNNDEFISTQI